METEGGMVGGKRGRVHTQTHVHPFRPKWRLHRDSPQVEPRRHSPS